MVAAPTPAGGPQGGPQAAFTYSSEPQAVPQKRSARSNYGGNATTPDAAPWMDENEVSYRLESVLVYAYLAPGTRYQVYSLAGMQYCLYVLRRCGVLLFVVVMKSSVQG